MDVSKKTKRDMSKNITIDMSNLTISKALEETSAKDQDNISGRIFQYMGNRLANKDFEDCCVVVDETKFSCHSFVLLSCSEFFRSKFRSNIKEKVMTVRLSNMSPSTFKLILETLYTGNNLLTANNIIDVWNAGQQLQIDFLIKLCEDFVLDQLFFDNLSMYKRHADNLHSKRVHLGILDFIKKHFPSLRNTEIFLNLDMEDLKQIIESDDLVADREDLVLLAVYEWVNLNQNDRKKYLAELLQSTRYCAASKSCITKLSKQSLTLNDSRVKEIFDRASAFNLDNYKYGFWPPAAIHRNCWGYEHVGVYCRTDDMNFVHLSLKENTVVDFKDIPALRAIKLAVVKDKLFACKGNNKTLDVVTLENNKWRRVCGFNLKTNPDKFLFMLAHNNCIFIFSRQKMRSFDPSDREIKFQENIYDISSPQHAISINNQILLFGSVANDGAEEATVHAWCSETKTWNHLVNLLFTATNMVSFEDESNWYILDPHGHFWKLSYAEPVEFTYIGKLWNVKLKLTGALLFRRSLYVYANGLDSVDSLNLKNDLGSGIFQDIKIHSTKAQMSNVVHLVKKK